IIIDAGNTIYASLTLESFNGRGTPQLDVVLLSTMGARRLGTRATSSVSLSSIIQNQYWSDETKRAVLTSIATLSYVKRTPGNIFATLRSSIEAFLDSLAIDFTLVP